MAILTFMVGYGITIPVLLASPFLLYAHLKCSLGMYPNTIYLRFRSVSSSGARFPAPRLTSRRLFEVPRTGILSGDRANRRPHHAPTTHQGPLFTHLHRLPARTRLRPAQARFRLPAALPSIYRKTCGMSPHARETSNLDRHNVSPSWAV